jgi:hypothetical protein
MAGFRATTNPHDDAVFLSGSENLGLLVRLNDISYMCVVNPDATGARYSEWNAAVAGADHGWWSVYFDQMGVCIHFEFFEGSYESPPAAPIQPPISPQ